MTEQVAETGPAYASDASGLREAAAALEDTREAERAAPMPDLAPDPTDGEAFEEANFNRNLRRNDVMATVQGARQASGKPGLDARTAADLLNALRKDEAVEAEQAAQQAVQQDVQQQVAPDQPAPETPEIAAARQQIEAQWQQPNQVRAQYEQALPLLLQALHEQQAGEFGDIQSIADVEKMAREDYQRYARWDAHHKKVGAVREQMQQAQVRQAQEIAARWQAFTVHEDAAFDAEHPELQDPAVRRQAAEAVVATLKAEGLTDQQLHALYNQSDLLRSKAGQSILWKASQWDRANAAMRNVRPVPKPPVQRPGVSMGGHRGEVQQRLPREMSLKEAAAFRAAQVRGQR